MQCAGCGLSLHKRDRVCGNCGTRVGSARKVVRDVGGAAAQPSAPTGTIELPPDLAPSAPSPAADPAPGVDEPAEPTPAAPTFVQPEPDRAPAPTSVEPQPALAPEPTPTRTPEPEPEPSVSPIAEETTFAPRRAVSADWTLSWGADESFALGRPVVFGRAPSAPAGYDGAHCVEVVDPDRSVSSSHAVFDVHGGAARVTDLGSTNGTVVVLADGRELQAEAGVPVVVPAGATVEMGAYPVRVDRAP